MILKYADPPQFHVFFPNFAEKKDSLEYPDLVSNALNVLRGLMYARKNAGVVCEQVVTSLLTSCQQVVFPLLVPCLL